MEAIVCELIDMEMLKRELDIKFVELWDYKGVERRGDGRRLILNIIKPVKMILLFSMLVVSMSKLLQVY